MMTHIVANAYQRVSIVLAYFDYSASSMAVNKHTRKITIYPSKESAKNMPTPLRCEQLDAVTDALEETGYRVKNASMSKDGTITVYPIVDGETDEVPPKGWRRAD